MKSLCTLFALLALLLFYAENAQSQCNYTYPVITTSQDVDCIFRDKTIACWSVCSDSYVIYDVTGIPNATYTWTVSGGGLLFSIHLPK